MKAAESSDPSSAKAASSTKLANSCWKKLTEVEVERERAQSIRTKVVESEESDEESSTESDDGSTSKQSAVEKTPERGKEKLQSLTSQIDDLFEERECLPSSSGRRESIENLRDDNTEERAGTASYSSKHSVSECSERKMSESFVAEERTLQERHPSQDTRGGKLKETRNSLVDYDSTAESSDDEISVRPSKKNFPPDEGSVSYLKEKTVSATGAGTPEISGKQFKDQKKRSDFVKLKKRRNEADSYESNSAKKRYREESQFSRVSRPSQSRLGASDSPQQDRKEKERSSDKKIDEKSFVRSKDKSEKLISKREKLIREGETSDAFIRKREKEFSLRREREEIERQKKEQEEKERRRAAERERKRKEEELREARERDERERLVDCHIFTKL